MKTGIILRREWRHPEELTIVAALVDTVLQNVADTTRVRILVNGEPAETLAGHVDLTRPLLYLRNEVAP